MAIIKPAARHKARRFALQALYQHHFTGASARQIREDLQLENNMSKVDMPYFDLLVNGVFSKISQLNTLLEPHLNRPVAEIDPVTLAVLHLGTFELSDCPEVPCAVVLNEAIKLVKLFGAQDSYKFVNGTLDKVAKVLRPYEQEDRSTSDDA